MIQRENWRLLMHPPAAGAWNMAVDEAILEAVGRGESPPTLRLYAWSPPCLSLGRNQPAALVDEERLRAKGWHWVRRPSGGGAILHTDELTYAVIAPADHPLMRGGVLASYRRIAAALVDALRALGVPAEVAGSAAEHAPAPDVCFTRPSDYEIHVGGRKILGSAQARRGGAVLQHGSLPLWGDLGRIAEALRFEDEAARRAEAASVRQKAITVAEALGREVEWAEVARAFRIAFAGSLGTTFQWGVLTPSEREAAVSLLAARR